ncbi:MAG: hypothetical protein F6K10_27335 [Moorea sp. SIO2B7]|nr:hypothetical protein [Moorena sp. SIO2B7]
MAGKLKLILMNQKEITTLGAGLRRINQKILSRDNQQGAIRVWYQGEELYNDLCVELQDQEIQWFQFTIRGKYLSWDKKSDCWHTGITNELRTEDLTFYPASKLIESEKHLDEYFIKLAYAILNTRAGEPIFDNIILLFEQINSVKLP